jgi:cysteine desulfurase
MIYLDYAAATPLDKRVLAAMQPYFSQQFYNPSATYLSARHVAQAVQEARASVAHWLGARPNEVIFTAGGTEANNLAIRGIMETHPDANLIVSAIEHESVLEPAKRYDVRLVPVLTDGRVDMPALEALIDDHTVLLSVMYANNEVGTIQPIRDIAQLIAKLRSKRRTLHNQLPLYLHTDACQAAAYLDLHVSRLGVDLMTINGGKIYGPKQSGVLFVKSTVGLQPQILGGGQEHTRRSGTENVAGIIGLAAALHLVQSRKGSEAKRLRTLQQLFLELVFEHITKAVTNGSLVHRLPNNVHITLPGEDNERLIMELDAKGVMAAAGSACSASNDQPSHVLSALGLNEAESQASLRFTMGHDTTEAAIRNVVKQLAAILHKQN